MLETYPQLEISVLDKLVVVVTVEVITKKILCSNVLTPQIFSI